MDEQFCCFCDFEELLGHLWDVIMWISAKCIKIPAQSTIMGVARPIFMYTAVVIWCHFHSYRLDRSTRSQTGFTIHLVALSLYGTITDNSRLPTFSVCRRCLDVKFCHWLWNRLKQKGFRGVVVRRTDSLNGHSRTYGNDYVRVRHKENQHPLLSNANVDLAHCYCLDHIVLHSLLNLTGKWWDNIAYVIFTWWFERQYI